MINLIPANVRKQVLREYWFRVISSWAFLFAGALFALSALIIPTFFLLNAQITASSYEIQKSDTPEVDFKEIEHTIKNTNILAGQLARNPALGNITDVVTAINSVAKDGVVVRTYSINRLDGSIDKVQMQGVAKSRESLAAFTKALEGMALFDTAVVPISNLARDADLPFEIQITITKR